ncbi:MAG: hypothetical protein M3319_11930 [Actinomycetota bacterium]|nr:hypothetical protein [Actinomycetota bacterium]
MVGGKPYDVRESRIKDLPLVEHKLVVIWRKRRYRKHTWPNSSGQNPMPTYS